MTSVRRRLTIRDAGAIDQGQGDGPYRRQPQRAPLQQLRLKELEKRARLKQCTELNAVRVLWCRYYHRGLYRWPLKLSGRRALKVAVHSTCADSACFNARARRLLLSSRERPRALRAKGPLPPAAPAAEAQARPQLELGRPGRRRARAPGCARTSHPTMASWQLPAGAAHRPQPSLSRPSLAQSCGLGETDTH
jgi:hypothetical protein